MIELCFSSRSHVLSTRDEKDTRAKKRYSGRARPIDVIIDLYFCLSLGRPMQLVKTIGANVCYNEPGYS